MAKKIEFHSSVQCLFFRVYPALKNFVTNVEKETVLTLLFCILILGFGGKNPTISWEFFSLFCCLKSSLRIHIRRYFDKTNWIFLRRVLISTELLVFENSFCHLEEHKYTCQSTAFVIIWKRVAGFSLFFVSNKWHFMENKKKPLLFLSQDNWVVFQTCQRIFTGLGVSFQSHFGIL